MPQNELILIRHGQSELNVGLTKGLNCDLTDIGRNQARELGRTIAGYDLRGFQGIVSPYRRAIETAREIGQISGLSFSIDERVREWGKTAEVNGRVYEHEPIERVVDRLHSFLADISGKNVIVVSHGAPIALLSDLAAAESPRIVGEFWLAVENCCFRRIAVKYRASRSPGATPALLPPG